jgi:hypothetical protein
MPGLTLNAHGRLRRRQADRRPGQLDHPDHRLDRPARRRVPERRRLQRFGRDRIHWPLTGDLNGLLRADYAYVGESASQFRPTYVYYEKQGDYGYANLRGGIEGADWGAYLFVNNVTNEVGLMSVTSALNNKQAGRQHQPAHGWLLRSASASSQERRAGLLGSPVVVTLAAFRTADEPVSLLIEP